MRRWRDRVESFIPVRIGERIDRCGRWLGSQRKADDEQTLYDDYRWGNKEKKRYYFVAAAAFGILGWLFYHHWLGMAISGLLSVPFQRVYLMIRLENQRTQGYSELRDMLYVLSGNFASGAGLKEGMEACCKMLHHSHGEKSLFLDQAEYMVRAMEDGNASEIRLFQEFAKRSGFQELKQVASIYVLCIRTGGDLPKAMIETSDAMLRRLQLWQEIRARTSQKRLEFTIMTAMIPILLAAVNGTSDYFSPLYGSTEGRCTMTAALLITVTAFLWSTRILEGGKH